MDKLIKTKDHEIKKYIIYCRRFHGHDIVL